MLHKKCTYCNEDKPITDFHLHGNGRHRGRCKGCENTIRKSRRAPDNPKAGFTGTEQARRIAESKIGKRRSESAIQSITEGTNRYYKEAGTADRHYIELSVRTLARYVGWRERVKERDNHRCVFCGAAENLHVHHIVSLCEILHSMDIRTIEQAKACDLLWSPDLGITLCQNHHLQVHMLNRRAEIVRNNLTNIDRGIK